MYYAPIYIPTLCRYEHLKRGLESLKKNTWARYTDVYIALDYPAKESHWEGYIKICNYLEEADFSSFAKFVVEKREKNYGASANEAAMRDKIMKQYDRWILAEDDIVFAPSFLEYMDKCLDYFEKDNSVLAINGYSYPLAWKTQKNATIIKQSATCSAWGIGFWRDKFNVVLNELRDGYLRNNFNRAVNDGTLLRMIDGRYYDYVIFALSGVEDGLYYNITDVALSIYLKLKNQMVITPTLTKTRNYGFDGTGVFCSKIGMITNQNSEEYDYEHQPMDESEKIEIIVDGGKYLKDNEQMLNDFLYVAPSVRRRAKVLMVMYKILGLKRCGNIYQKLKGLFKGKNIK